MENWFYESGAGSLWEAPAFADRCFDWQPTFPRPRQRDSLVMGLTALRPAAFVSGLLFLHQFGLDLSTRAAVDAVRPSLMQRDRLDQHELRVFWAPQEMGRMEGTDICVPDDPEVRLPLECTSGNRLSPLRRTPQRRDRPP